MKKKNDKQDNYNICSVYLHKNNPLLLLLLYRETSIIN